jgi:hypothetical protein
MFSFRLPLSDRKHVNDVNKWRAQFVKRARCCQPVVTSLAIITNMVSGAANLKSSAIKQVFI